MKNQKGFSLVELLVVVIIIAIIAAIAIPNLLASRRAANEASAIASLRTIHSAQVTYQSTQGGGTNFGDFTALTNAPDSLLDPTFAATPVHKAGYTFVMSNADPTTYCVTAEPDTGAGIRDFAIDYRGVVQFGAAAATVACDATDLITGGTVLGQ
jgi:prepilin-type N-terminal cleavage/methylation domain-containing protein